MHAGRLKLGILAACFVAGAWEIWHLKGGSPRPPNPPVLLRHKPDRALLPEAEITAYAKLFAAPKSRVETWEPTVAEIEGLEDNLPQVTALSRQNPDPDRHLENPDQYFRQYLAVVIDGKKDIFVNSLCSVEQTKDWRKRLTIPSGGGKCFWHAVYDPATRKFSDLIVNGVS